MLRHHINLGVFQYVVDLYDAAIDLGNERHYENFVMFRRFKLMNSIADTTDIYIISKDVYDSYVAELKAGNDKQDVLVFPIPNTQASGFSRSYMKFNPDYTEESIYDGDGFGYDCYPLCNSKGEPAEIQCNKMRIYHPSIKGKTDAIIYVNNLVNNIRVHYLCRLYDKFPVNSETEFKVENSVYSEFIEIWLPNVMELFGENSDVYYYEDLNIIASRRNDNFMTELNINTPSSFFNDSGAQLVPFRLFAQPYRIVTENGENVKQYLKIVKSIENNYLNYPLNVVMYPYSEVESVNGIYMLDDYYGASENTFTTGVRFSLSSQMAFSNHHIAILTKFNYPKIREFVGEEGYSALRKAYEFYNNVNADVYESFSELQAEVLYGDIDRIESVTTLDKEMVAKKYGLRQKLSEQEYLELYKKMRKDAIREELEESLETKTDFLGFRVVLSSDKDFTNVIYDNNVTIDFADLDDFAFELNNVFKHWVELPEHLVARVTFIDRFLGIQLNGNPVVITKEWFKYMIDDDGIGRLDGWETVNEKYNTAITEDGIYDMREIELNEDKVNFLNNITCIIRKEDTNVTNAETTNKSATPRVLYRPVFYRVSDLQNIQIRARVKQKIGVNLGQFMTKVETFKMSIDGKEYVEYARNDVYVIFEILASQLSSASGTYDIVNQDDEYISSGAYTVY